MAEKKRGLIIIYTGDGKGKTTAALGTVLRAAAYGWKILIVQFIKGSWKYGEMESLKLLPKVELKRMGKGFVGIIDDKLPFADHVQAAEEALDFVKTRLNDYQLIVLDEINGAIKGKLISPEPVIEMLKNKPEKLHIILTGRGANPALIQLADLVTEMKEIKHPFQKGMLAQKGIDY